MFLRYSSSVVAPIHCSSPRASAGLSRLDASIAPSAAPAPTTVCSSSINRTICPAAPRTSSITPFRRSSNSPRNFAPAIIAPKSSDSNVRPAQRFRHIARLDLTRQPFDDGGLADAGVADQDGVVLGAPRQNLDDAHDFFVAPDHGVDLALARQQRQVARVFGEHLILRFRVRLIDPLAPPNLLQGAIHALLIDAHLRLKRARQAIPPP